MPRSTAAPWCALLLAALPVLAGARAPSVEQVQAAVNAAGAGALPASATASDRGVAPAPSRLRELPFCQPARDAGTTDCIIGIDIGPHRNYRMLRLAADGDGWRTVDTLPRAPLPPLSVVQAQLKAEIKRALASEADPSARQALAAEIGRARALEVRECWLRQQAPELDCQVQVQAGSRQLSRDMRFRVRDGRWQALRPG